MNPISRFVNEIPDDLIEGMEEAKTAMFGRKPVFGRQPENNARPKRRTSRVISSGAENEAWAPGDKANHKKWGKGTVVKVEGTGEAMELDIAFPAPTGIKRVLARFAPITKE